MPTTPMNKVIQYLRSTLVPEEAELTDGQLLKCFVTRREPAALEALPAPSFGRFTMKTNSMAYFVIVFALASGTLRGSDVPSGGRPSAVPKWEYQILTKEQVIEVGKKDLTTGLNKLGDQGWELAAVETAYIFKRAKSQNGVWIEDVKRQIALTEADLEMRKDRVAWAERMLKKGFMSEAQVKGDRMELTKTEINLDFLRRELQSLSSDPSGPARNTNPSRQPELIKVPKP